MSALARAALVQQQQPAVVCESCTVSATASRELAVDK